MSACRVFSLLIPFFFFTSVHVEQTVAPVKPVTVEAKDEAFTPQYPDQYLSWRATSEQSECVDVSAGDSRLVILWAGYPFSHDYNKPRGHVFAIAGVRGTLRTGAPKNAEDGSLPTACWSYKSPNVVRLIQEDGEDSYFHDKQARGSPKIVNNLGRADCYNTAPPEFAKGEPELILPRPYAACAMEVIGGPFEKAGRFDQQSVVCGQYHAGYYSNGKNRAVKFPWDDGMEVENMEQHYDRIVLSGWTNSLSKTLTLKTQYLEYETQTAGIHSKNSVTCIDCHMSGVQSAESKLYTDHKIGNPFNNFAQTCANCHTQDKTTSQKAVAERKQLINSLRIKVENQLARAYFEVKAALDIGATETEMKPIQDDIRHVQWRWGLTIASHGIRMHAPEEGLRILGTAMDKVADARTRLTRLLATKDTTHEIQVLDISTKEKTQQVVGLNIEQVKAEKQDFIKTVIPQWEGQARKSDLLSQ